MKRIIAFSLFFPLLIFSISVQAQRNCGVMENLDRLILENPQIRQQMEAIEQQTRDFLKAYDGAADRNVVTIPVVVHVIYKTGAQNISDAQVGTQIDVLNDDFRRMNADADNAWSQAADVGIEFCLATVAPDGSSTNGIIRKRTNKPSFGVNDQMKFDQQGGSDAWPASDYLNIWVCNLQGGYLGYAQFPGGPAATDGVVIDYAAFGTIGTASAPFDLGRTGTHEVGHWLNLRHIWGDGGCSVDDFVADTPVSDAPNYGCPAGHVSCGTVDMIENYMDYSDDACMNLFTSGQGGRMNALFGPGGARASLLASGGCGVSGGGPSCTDGIQNGDETGVDCGGSCPQACPTCSDGIQNGDETGIDCGGSCPDCPPIVCDVPVPTGADAIKKKSAKLNWDAVSGAVSYNIRYRASGTTAWNEKTATGTSVTATGLDPNTTYEWQVQSTCNGGTSAWSTACTFTADQPNSSSCGGARIFTAGLEVFPNPASQQVRLKWGALGGEAAELLIYNSVGAVVERRMIDPLENTLEIGVSGWMRGMYFVKIQSGAGEGYFSKLILQ